MRIDVDFDFDCFDGMRRRNHGGTYGGAAASLILVSSGPVFLILFNSINIIGNFYHERSGTCDEAGAKAPASHWAASQPPGKLYCSED